MSDGNTDGVSDECLMGLPTGCITGVLHIKFGDRLFYVKEVTCIYHVSLKFGVQLSVIARSVQVNAYSASCTSTNFFLITSAVHPYVHDTIVYCVCHFQYI